MDAIEFSQGQIRFVNRMHELHEENFEKLSLLQSEGHPSCLSRIKVGRHVANTWLFFYRKNEQEILNNKKVMRNSKVHSFFLV